MALTQGGALPSIGTQQTQTTTTPSWYTDYLQGIASSGASAADNAKFIGIQPMQQQSYDLAKSNVGNYQPTLDTATGALESGISSTSPLAAGQPYLTSAAVPTYETVDKYMSPYLQNVVSQIGNLAQQNMLQNVAPQATAGAVGTGQFGSKRGAEVLGQTLANYGQQTTGQQLNALNTGYQNALTQAGRDAALQAQIGQTSGQLASAGQQNLINAGAVGGNLASTTQQLGLGDVNALNMLGTQQQQILQAEQLFPLQMAQAKAGLMQGINVPTSVQSNYLGPIPGAYQASPLSQIAGIGSLLGGISQTPFGQSIGQGISSLFGSSPTANAQNAIAQYGAGNVYGFGGSGTVPNIDYSNPANIVDWE